MKGWIIALAVLGVIGIIGFMFIGWGIGKSNEEVILRTTIEAKQKDNTSEFDNMYKKISQVAQVSTKQLEALKDIFNSHAQARTGNGKGGELMKWVQESVPHVDTTTMNNLQNIITGSRDAWTFRQKELVDLSREHNKLLRLFPNSLLFSFLGRKSIDITIVTSGRTSEAFATGKDDDTDVFKK